MCSSDLLAHQYVNAIGAYRSYLRRLPDSPNRSEVEDRIRELQKLLDQAPAPPAQTNTIVPPPSPIPPQTASVETPPSNRTASSVDRTQERALKIGGVSAFSLGIAVIALGGGFDAIA